MVKERYKDDSLNIADAREKVKALITEHLIDLGINPRNPPIELLSPDFMERLAQHASGDPESKASEMEHAIRSTTGGRPVPRRETWRSTGSA